MVGDTVRKFVEKEKAKAMKVKIKLSSEYKEYTIDDMANWYVETRGFPEILTFGTGKNEISGEGQGGRIVSAVAKKVENEFVKKLGKNHYIYLLDEILHPERLTGIIYEDVEEDINNIY